MAPETSPLPTRRSAAARSEAASVAMEGFFHASEAMGASRQDAFSGLRALRSAGNRRWSDRECLQALVGRGGLEPPNSAYVSRPTERVGRGHLRFAFARAGRSLTAFGCIANLYSQAGAVAGAARRREADNRIRQEPWGGFMRRSGRTFKPMVQGSNPCAGTTRKLQAARWLRALGACLRGGLEIWHRELGPNSS